jgi:hypothetical protein
MEVDYDVAQDWIKSAPTTMLPATLINVVNACLDKKVFKSGADLRLFVKNAVDKHFLNERSPVDPR